MVDDARFVRDALEELLFAYRNPLTVRRLSAIAQHTLLRALRSAPEASVPGHRFLLAAELLRDEASARGIGEEELARWSQPQAEGERARRWATLHAAPPTSG